MSSKPEQNTHYVRVIILYPKADDKSQTRDSMQGIMFRTPLSTKQNPHIDSFVLICRPLSHTEVGLAHIGCLLTSEPLSKGSFASKSSTVMSSGL